MACSVLQHDSSLSVNIKIPPMSEVTETAKNSSVFSTLSASQRLSDAPNDGFLPERCLVFPAVTPLSPAE